MRSDGIPVRYGALLSLLAIAPVVVFLLDRGETAIALAVANVVVITASLYVMYGPADEGVDEQPSAE